MPRGGNVARRPGEYSLSEAAAELEVHPNTVRRWAQGALAGEPSRLRLVRVDLVGRYWVQRGDVERLRLEELESNGLLSSRPATDRL